MKIAIGGSNHTKTKKKNRNETKKKKRGKKKKKRKQTKKKKNHQNFMHIPDSNEGVTGGKKLRGGRILAFLKNMGPENSYEREGYINCKTMSGEVPRSSGQLAVACRYKGGQSTEKKI